MGRTTSVTIGENLDSFVERLIKSGRYGSTSEVVRSALRLLEQQENQLELLRKAVLEGEESGESTLSLKEIAAQRKARLNV
ncbi:type II toxin-antitoxin system ParD family antitoxin [Grimontia hollisae]|uniref:Antitoxin ParD n=1 Tax=Grimontia hollisae CIP 101886 TaxID=675812 RepID=D0I2R6_GRIHO|nr:type II toxin-antitoxin system ParD family antitoxin [Grimontia hollisae]EEY74222.1 predicted transcriptional regulator [Grimontia hollisae CIP 101886]MDF2185261.1 type II toxin-antitoxin system ParD family antitoxin [Grimontia hollisae]STO79478.1 Antitoxin ParD1 [Grimontia hollisae]